MHDSLTDSVLEYIERLKYPVIILANSISSKTLKNTKCYGNLRNFIFVTDRNLFEIDKSSLSYFFSLAPKYKSSNIFVPRIEIPEVSMKYLIFMKNNIKE
jgi:hypothetical protein